jgi:hypothetical protein
VHAVAGEDLQCGVGDELACLAGGVHDPPGETGVDLADAALVVDCGWSANILAVAEAVLCAGELFQAQQPVLEAQIVEKAGVGGPGVPLSYP